jgi:hypothetical protein
MTDSVIDYALECTPAQERARLTKIVDALTQDEAGEVASRVYRAVSRFNLYRSDSPGSAGATAYEALAGAIQAVKRDLKRHT